MPTPIPTLKLPKDLAAKVKTSVMTALDRADELGGDLRDYLQDRWQRDPRIAKLKARFGRAAAPGRAAGAGAVPGGARDRGGGDDAAGGEVRRARQPRH